MKRSEFLEINRARLLVDLADLSRIGGRPDGGVDRVGWTEPELAARHWVQQRLEDAGLLSHVDPALNVFGRVSKTRRRRLLIGSHTDSVSNGGRLDGAYGVVAALEVLRTLTEAGDPAAELVELVDFADEEGVRFQGGYFGSKALVGELDPAAFDRMVDTTGVPVPDVLRAAGVKLDQLNRVSKHLPDVAGFIELHIEQGPRLESGGYSVGPVIGILGVDRYRVTIQGRSTHGGTTPFELRHDPAQVAAQLIVRIPKIVSKIDAAGVATVGVISSSGGAINFTPSEVELSLELRQPTRRALTATVASVKRQLAAICKVHHCKASINRQPFRPEEKDGVKLAIEPASIPPAKFDRRMVAATASACSDLRLKRRRLYAGTWHDAGIMAARVPTGMLLVPSRRGITHSPQEHTPDEDLVDGTRALLRATQRAVAALGL
jgi:beta-ureidopropionase / N-carbamoyl-L-amino-acid hydrolase